MSKVKVICQNPKCGCEYEKPRNEYNRSIKIGRKFYCSRSCAGQCSNEHLKKYGEIYKGNLVSHNRRDKYTGLREHLRRVKNRNKLFDITLQDLLELWEKQKGVCVYTGVKLTHPAQRKNENLIYTASLDRINSSKGYHKNNIQFISVTANYAKSNLTHEQMVDFCKVVTNHWS